MPEAATTTTTFISSSLSACNWHQLINIDYMTCYTFLTAWENHLVKPVLLAPLHLGQFLEFFF